MKTTAGLKPGDKLYWYTVKDEKAVETIASVVDQTFVKTKEEPDLKVSIRFFQGRIKSREPRREWYLGRHIHSGRWMVFDHNPQNADEPCPEVVHVREVREKKVKV